MKSSSSAGHTQKSHIFCLCNTTAYISASLSCDSSLLLVPLILFRPIGGQWLGREVRAEEDEEKSSGRVEFQGERLEEAPSSNVYVKMTVKAMKAEKVYLKKHGPIELLISWGSGLYRSFVNPKLCLLFLLKILC